MTWVTWILYPFLIIGTSIQFASAGTRYNYHQHLIHLTQAIFAFDTFPRWKKLFKPSKPSLTTLLPKNCFPLCPNHSKANTHTHQPRWQAALNRAASLLLVDSLTTCPGPTGICSTVAQSQCATNELRLPVANAFRRWPNCLWCWRRLSVKGEAKTSLTCRRPQRLHPSRPTSYSHDSRSVSFGVLKWQQQQRF